MQKGSNEAPHLDNRRQRNDSIYRTVMFLTAGGAKMIMSVKSNETVQMTQYRVR